MIDNNCFICKKSVEKGWFTVEYESMVCENCIEQIFTHVNTSEEADVIRNEFQEDP